MAKIVCAFLLILAMAFMIQVVYAVGEGSLSPKDCPHACAYRCAGTGMSSCPFECWKCCMKCLCVPTFAHMEECPCYNNLKTPRGRPRCP